MTRQDLVYKITNRKKELGLTNANIASLSGITERTVMRLFAGLDVKFSTIEKITQLLGIDFAGNEVIDINTLRHNRARTKALYVASMVQDTSSLEQQGLNTHQLDKLVSNIQNRYLNEYQKNLWN
jgi:predicted transcriptional regulator